MIGDKPRFIASEATIKSERILRGDVTMATGDLVDRVMSYENGDMTEDQIVPFFGELVRSGLAWQLQGSYGRTAVALIKHGKLSQSGEVLA